MQLRLESPNLSRMPAMILWILLALSTLASGIVDKSFNLHNQIPNSLHFSQPNYESGKFPFLMPNVQSKKHESYFCTPIKVDYLKNYFIVGFEPQATMNTTHHMILFGCGEPGMKKSTWDCSEMAEKGTQETASPCGVQSHSQVLYAWARNAPKLKLPENVGFKVGRDSPIKYLVLQVHYAHSGMLNDGHNDQSGVILQYTSKPIKYLAGVLLLGTMGVIQPMSVEHLEVACEISENKTIYPFAYRVHTHSLGKLVAGYRVRADSKGKDQWTQLGKRDPMQPQMFYPIDNREPIVPGDTLAARCTMESQRQRVTEIGPSNEDEMCNFYLMYFVKRGEPLNTQFCFSYGAPIFYWTNPDTGLNNIPDKEASTP